LENFGCTNSFLPIFYGDMITNSPIHHASASATGGGGAGNGNGNDTCVQKCARTDSIIDDSW